MKLLRVFPPIAVLLLVGVLVSPAHAQLGPPINVVQTGCDTLSFNPPLVHVTFGVINLGPIPVCSIHLIPIPSGSTPPDSCRIIRCSSAPGWLCQQTPDGGAVWTIDTTQPGPGCIQTGQKQEPFDVVLDPLFCCYNALFDDGTGAVFFSTTVCFECQKPVAAKQTTWGAVKSIYH
jgi:hypothetical protein